MHDVYVDGDACPVKDEVYRVAERLGVRVLVVANQHLHIPNVIGWQAVRVPGGPDVADDWIAERAGPGDVVVSDDVPLAARCVARGAEVVTSRGRVLDTTNVGQALADRDLMQSLRDGGMNLGGPSSFTRADRSTFANKLDQLLHRARREHAPQ